MAVTATQTTVLQNDVDTDTVIDPADIINPVPTTGDTVRTTVVITNASGPDATGVFFVENGDGHLNGMTQVGNINVSPIAFNDSYSAIGNTLLEVGNATTQTGPQSSAAGSVIANDVEFFGDTFTISSPADSLSANGGTVHMVTSGADMGSFYYVSAANFTGTDTFTYTLRDKGLDGVAGNSDDLVSTATVTITVANQVWYVDNNYAGANGASDGTSFRPYTALSSLSGASGLDDAGDTIYVASSGTNYGGGIALLADQKLIGGGEALVISATTLKAAGADATIVNTASGGVGVALAANNTLKGFTVGDTGTAGNGTDISGAAVGNLVISNVDLTGTGRMVNLTGSGGTASVTFDSATTTSSSTNGVILSNIDGSVTFGSTPGSASIAGTTGTAFSVTGGTGNIDFNGAISKTTNGRVIDIAGHTSGTVSFDGDVTSSSAADGISLVNNTSAIINFTDTVSITKNSDNGLAAFNATGGGTITTTGTGNTIDSGAAVALNLSGTTIGAADLTFQSISANGAVNGIVLNNTGTLGGLTVTGTGTANSGGTIANTTGDGIVLTSTSDVVLQRMLISGSDDDGIHGTNVNNFVFRDSTISGFGNQSAGASEDGMDFTNLTGTVAIQRSTIGAQQGFTLAISPPTPDNKGIIIRNDNVADLNMTVTGSTFTQIDNDGIDIEINRGDGSLVVDGSTADGTNTFSQINGRAITFGSTADNAANGVLDLNVKNSTFNTVGIGVRWAAQGGTDINAAVRDNTMTAVSNDAVRGLADPSDASFGASTSVDAIVEGNNFGGGSVFIASRRAATTNILLGGGEAAGQTGNTNIGGFGISLEANRAGILNIDVLNNTVNANVAEPGTINAALYVQSANSGGGSSTITAKISGNSFQADANDDPIGDVVFDNLSSVIRLEGFGGGDPTAFITGSNTFPADGVTDVAFSGAVTGFAGDAVPTGGPSLGFLMAAAGGVETTPPAETAPSSDNTLPGTAGTSGGQPPAGTAAHPVIVDDGVLSQAELDYFVAAALARWSAAGLSADQVSLIGTTGFAVASMPGMYLGSFAPGQITLDDNAAGYGWYLDPTPLDDVEFGTVWSPTRLMAGTTGAPAGHIDLLTTLMHEMGHQLGLGDSYSLDDRDELMYGYLVTGERRLPGEGEADGATPGSIASEEFLVGPINIGTIPVGQTVTIQWDATIDAQSNALIANLSNQGTVTGNQPGAFSVNTDGDGNSGNGIQATITVLDSLSLGNQVFWDKDANGVFDGADVGIDGVTLSLFVDANNDNAPDSPGSPIATTTTAGGGLYSFAGIAPGHYIVRVDAANFTGPAGALRFLQTSPTTTPEPIDPDGNVNNDDNGSRTLGQPAFTGAITLTYNNEPVGGTSNDTNNTLDLGFTNIAPVLDDDATPTLTAINEDAGAPGVGAGTLVSQLVDLTPPVGGIDNVTDADSTQTGMALTGVDNTNGVWKYSLNGGNTWTNVPAVSDNSALLLAADADTRIYFQPNANFNGTSSITFRAWDQTDGNAEGSTADPTPAGASTAYSVDFDSAGITVNAVNDAPQFAGLNGTPTYTENGAAVVLDNNATISDVDLDAANDYGGATLTLVRSTGTNPDDIFSDDNGTLTFGATDVSLGGIQVGTYTHTNGTLVITFDAGATSAQADSVLQLLTYRNSNDNPPASVTINYEFSDGNSGAQGSGATPGLATGSVVVTITATNDAPELDDNATPVVTTINEDAGAPGVGSGTLVSALVDLTPPAGGLDNVTDVDNAVTGIAITLADNANGTWMYSINGGANWLAVGAVTDDSARVLFADANTRVYFQPNANFFGSSSITFRAWDRSDAVANGASGIDPSPGGGSSAYSFDSDSASVTVTSVNDQPLFAGLNGTPTYTEDGAAVVLDNNATVSDVELDAANNYDGATLTLVRSTGTNADDVFNDGSGTLTFGATDVSLTGTGQVGTYTHVNGTLVITFNSSATSAAVDSVLQQLTYRNTSDTPTTPTVTINYTFDDGNAGAQGSTFTPGIGTGSIVVSITAVNDPPTLDLDDNDSSTATGADYKGIYIPAGAAVAIADGDSLIGDVDDTNIESATITIFNAKPNDLLSVAGGLPPGITVDGASTATNLILTGSASKAAYETALEQVRFSNTNPAPDTETRDITVVLNDGTDPSNTAHAFILVNNPPSAPADTDAAADAVTEGAGAGTAVGIDANSIDPEATTVTYSFAPAGDAGGRFVIDSTTGIVTVSAAGATTIDFEASGGSYAVTIRATDGDGAFVDQGFTVTVNDVAPTQPVDAAAPTGGTVQEGAPNTTAVGITAFSTDVNGGTPTYTITAGNADGAFAIDSGTGIITVADATKIDFETATSRLITVQATAGSLSSTQDFTIQVTNAQPTFTADNNGGADTVSEGAVNGATVGITAKFDDVNGGTITYTLFDDASGRFTIDSTTGVVTVADATLLNFEGSSSHNITVRGSDPSGAFNDQGFTIVVTNVAPVATGDGYSVAEDGSLSVLATGVLGNDSDVHGGAITAVLDVGPANAASFTLNGDGSFTYTPNGDFFGPDSFTYHAFDGTAAGNTVTVNLTVTEVNDTPTATDDPLASIAEDSGTRTILFADLTGNDVKGPANEAGQTLTVSMVNNAIGGSVAIVAGHVEFTPFANFNGAASFEYTTTDNGTSNGVGDPKSDVGLVTFTVTEVNDAPVAADDTLSAVAEDSSTRTITFAELTGNDNKGAANESGQTLTVLSVNNGTAVGGTVAIVAGHIEFTPTANFFGTASFEYTVQDDGTTNGVGDPKTDIGLASFQVTAVNDAPALANVDAAAAYTENAAPVALDTVPLIVPSDIDTATLSSATIAITGGFQPGDVLNWPNFPIPASLSASYNAATGVLTINAVDTLADFQEVLRGITFSSTSDNPTNFGANPTRTVTWTITDNGSPNLSSVSQTTTIAVTAVNDAPSLDNVASTVNLPPGGGTVTLSPGLTVSDVDSHNLVSATVRVTDGLFPGDGNVLAANTAGTSITAVYNAGTDTLTLSGADTLAHYQQVLATVTFQTTSPNPTNSGLNPTRTIEWQLNDGSGVANLSTVDTTTVDLSNVPTSDFNADANSDILWRHITGFVAEWQMNGGQLTQSVGVAHPTNAFRFQDTGDFNADAKADILWRHAGGQVSLWTMDGEQIVANQVVADINNSWDNQGAADFGGDGKSDVLWHNKNSGQVALWTMDGAQITNNQLVGSIDASWHVQGLLDANGDGKSDVLLRHNNGQVVLWTMDGAQITNNQSIANLGLDWNIVGTGDFGGDGKDDVLLRNDNGQVVIWGMDGATIVSNQSVETPSNVWQVQDVGDYNGDSRSDILWRHETGQVVLWEMNGSTIAANHEVLQQGQPAKIGLDWTVQNHHYDLF